MSSLAPLHHRLIQILRSQDVPAIKRQFFDFRNLDNGTTSSNYTAPPPINESQDEGIEPITSPFFGKGLFGDYFTPASWNKSASEVAPVFMVNSQQNVYLGELLRHYLVNEKPQP
ncbi:MAG: hypothetical protein Q9201_003396 [Fulgogasparrea decipioides]